MSEVTEAKERAKFVWSQGDYAEVAKKLEPAAEAIVEACGVGPGTRVLDVAAGNGNVAVAAAKRGATVVASDITPELVEAGKKRAAAEGLDIQWREADAEELPFEDDEFDVVTSAFGAMFAPRADHVAAELLRVVKPGRKVGFTAWTEDGFTGQNLKMTSKYLPVQPEGIDGPLSWGNEAAAKQRFQAHASNVQVTRGTVKWAFESADAWEEWSQEHVPPVVVAKKMLPPETFAQIREESHALVARFNNASDGSMDIDGEYLLIVATK